MGPAALVSVHDLMPETMPAVHELLRLLEDRRVRPVTLLVVPGSGWDRSGIAELRALQRDGLVLAGHGWRHRVDRISRPYHRLHSLLISRHVAEHLALDEDGILDLIGRCRRWFGDHGLDAPALYVPPAWAMGSVSRARLAADCPFPLCEVFTGVLRVADGHLHRSPLLGYEADRLSRIPILRVFNALSRRRASAAGVIRIGIHPFDARLHLRADLIRDLERRRRFVDYPAAISAAAAGAASGGARPSTARQ
jgi:predicted deacetylase